MKIGDLERTHQVWRQHADLRRAFPSGPDTYYSGSSRPMRYGIA
jgi:hypothetical protein